ncbi:DNA polymerase III subunit delta [Methylocapsa sp. S129]|uniref:DNA polymerase III subunit delta n=1 Tax=Methylocapsa sp. S129 TaxID=1641869 RepID=UPI00131B3749|nr:DNA polymerase III subunit delta [Methylocapsa sp. S129]
MTIVANSGADQFVKRLPRDMFFFLVHGNDEGLIRERSRGIVNSLLEGDSDPLRLIRFDGDAVAREPGTLAEEADAVSMFGGSRVIWIELQARDIAAALEPLFKAPPRDCAIVVEAGSLKKGTALRSAFEKMGNGVSIECYPDDRRSIAALIDAEARQVGLSVPPDVRDYLVSLLGSDRMTTRGEIAKLLLYAEGNGAITIADIEAVVSDAAPSALDDAVDHAFLGDNSGIEETANRYFGDGGDPGSLLRVIIARAMLLHRLRLAMEDGRSFEAAMQAQYVRLSPLRRGALEKQAGRWSVLRLGGLLRALRPASANVRRDTNMAQAIAMRALWAIASSARAGLS